MMKATAPATATATDNQFSALVSDSNSDSNSTDSKTSDRLYIVYQAAVEADIQLLEDSWIIVSLGRATKKKA